MKPHLQYLLYLLRHKWYVLRAGIHTKAPLWRLVIHDWSKFLPSEWFSYVKKFYGSDEPLSRFIANLEFDQAWLKHQHRNPHHWQYWVLRDDSGDVKLIPVPDHFLREMAADWLGAGRAITGTWDAVNWYRENWSKIMLSEGDHVKIGSILIAAAYRLKYKD